MDKPSSRVQITVEVDNNGAKESKELPLKLLVLANASRQATSLSIAKRKKHRLTKSNFNQTLQAVDPHLNVLIKAPDKQSDIPIHLRFNHINDFRPEAIVQQVPHLKKLMAMRNILKDLKANMVDNQGLTQSLKKLGQKPAALKQLKTELCHMKERDDDSS